MVGEVIDWLLGLNTFLYLFLTVICLAVGYEISSVFSGNKTKRLVQTKISFGSTHDTSFDRPRDHSLFNRKKLSFQRMRVKAFPPPYANGWYMIAYDEELQDNKIKSLSALGRHFVIVSWF